MEPPWCWLFLDICAWSIYLQWYYAWGNLIAVFNINLTCLTFTLMIKLFKWSWMTSARYPQGFFIIVGAEVVPGRQMIFFVKQQTFHGLQIEDAIFAFYCGYFFHQIKLKNYLQLALLVKAVEWVTWWRHRFCSDITSSCQPVCQNGAISARNGMVQGLVGQFALALPSCQLKNSVWWPGIVSYDISLLLFVENKWQKVWWIIWFAICTVPEVCWRPREFRGRWVLGWMGTN